ncbi:type II toxin-antitoxin system death-on-curing family toxin [Deefgea rivuli]|uniref:type II toxin-antitoxin system death-on-curing family toxin n=1 Tax=Deefgea rivuli TaxID=400948 RepID=UPI000485DBAA|nr:type II toxin-antitoxin system death-on-curing family toxin [Deefgea rivuli]
MIASLITATLVCEIHDEILTTEAGVHGYHGSAALEGALGRIMHAVDYDGLDDVFEIAAMYAISLSRGHCFADANKRTALVTALTYLQLQGFDIDRDAELEEIMVDVAQGKVDRDALADLLFDAVNSTEL